MRITKFNAFTLAEVLITLAIIGVVAAMTMPTLINNTNGAQFKTAYKKALSVLNQAVVMNIALDDYDLAGTSADESGDAKKTSVFAMFENRTNGNGKLVSADTGANMTTYKTAISTNVDNDADAEADDAAFTNNFVFQFQDGIVFTFPKTAKECTEASPCTGFIDTNGQKGPNKLVTCEATNGNCTKKATINDIFPIRFYDQTVAPNSPAARAVLYGSENMEETTPATPSSEG